MSLRETLDFSTNFENLANKFMAHDGARIQTNFSTMEGVQVAAAEARHLYLDDGVRRLLDPRIIDLLDCYFFYGLKADTMHRSPSWLAQLLIKPLAKVLWFVARYPLDIAAEAGFLVGGQFLPGKHSI